MPITKALPNAATVPPVSNSKPFMAPLQNKDTRILYQGIIQALVQSPALPQYSASLDEYKKLVLSTAEELAAFIVAKG